MDQIVERNRRIVGAAEQAAPAEAVNQPSVEEALGLNARGARKRRGGWLYAMAAIAIAVAGLGYWQFGGSTAPVTYATTPAQTGDITVEVSATGTLQPLIQVDISSELSGVMRSVAVEENQIVKKGDVLAELDTTRLAAQIERAKASVKSAEAKVMEAKTTLTETEQTLRARPSNSRSAAWPRSRRSRRRVAARDRAVANVAMARSQSCDRRGRSEAAGGRPREEHHLRADRRHRADALGRSRPDGRLVACRRRCCSCSPPISRTWN